MGCDVLIEPFGDAVGRFRETSVVASGTNVEIRKPFGHIVVVTGGDYDEFLTARQSFVGDGGTHGMAVCFGRDVPTFGVGEAELV